jgi:hypothetical protein
LRRGLLLVLLSAACGSSALAPPDLAAPPPDLSAVVRDLSAANDLMSLPDLVYPGDAPPCAGGYLNSDAGNACPLSCSPAVEAVPDEGAIHVAYGTPVVYKHNPPASGPHWPFPAPWGFHPEGVAREWWVHNLEHQGIVLLYNCPGGDAGAVNACSTEIDQLRLLALSRQPDQFNEVRIVITPDPLLPKRFAAVAWDWDLLADSFDMAAFQCFIDARYGRGPEQIP